MSTRGASEGDTQRAVQDRRDEREPKHVEMGPMGSGDDSAATAAVTVGGELRAIMSLSCVIFISLSSFVIMKVTDR
jgi:hypothetical protein